MSTDWAEYLRLLRAGVDQPTAATVVHEQVRRRPGRNGRASAPREHGTERGYRQHRTDRTPACPDCLAAHAQHNTAWRAAA